MNPLDLALSAAVPVQGVPAFTPLLPLLENGHRLLVARDGLWLELRRPWLYLCWPVGPSPALAIPYGALTRRLQLVGDGKLPISLMQRFAADALDHAQVERAAWIVWDEHIAAYVYREVDTRSAGSGHIRYDCPRLPDHEHLAIDLHSHGQFSASFSKQDDRDDHGAVKLSFVIGDCHRQPTVCLRLCALGLFIDIPWRASR